MKLKTFWFKFRMVPWATWHPLFRRNIYDNKWEHLEYVYFGKINLMFGWLKREFIWPK